MVLNDKARSRPWIIVEDPMQAVLFEELLKWQRR